MKIDYKKITMPIDLAIYADAYQWQVVHVWVSLPTEMKKERAELLRNYAAFLNKVTQQNKFIQWLTTGWQKEKLRDLEHSSNLWLSKLWSQHTDKETHWTVKEIKAINNADNVFFTWLVNQTVKQIEMYAESKKKE